MGGSRDYVVEILVGFTVLASIIAFLAQSIYRDFFESILKLAATEEYSYLAVSLTSILAVSYLSMKYSGLSRSIHLSRLLVSGLLVVLAVLVYLISRRVLEYCVYLQGLSFALLFISLATVIYDIKSPTYIAPLFTVLLATPLPAAFSDSVASILSRFVGRVIAYVTNSKLSELSMPTYIEVETSEGMRALTIETFSTGTDVLSTVASAIPAVLLSISIGRASWSRKAAVSAASIAAALAIGFLGCVLRVLAVVYSAQRVGVEVAVESLHYVPSAIYSSASALLAFYLVFRYCGIGESVSKPLEVSRYTG
ncbi:MAG: hypothetical protein RMH84_06580, partial [Sulfolobales archaeon]|nr:hypothetical protein [Sulfolobales archaeon]